MMRVKKSKPEKVVGRWGWGQLKRLRKLWRYLAEGHAYTEGFGDALPSDSTGYFVINFDKKEHFRAENKEEGWAEARRRWGKEIAHPPIWVVDRTQTNTEVTAKRP